MEPADSHQRNQNQQRASLEENAIAALASGGECKDVQILGQESTSSHTEDLGNGIKLEMIAIPGGSFMMGSPDGEGRNNEKPQHEVTVSSFFLGKYPITQAQYQQIMSKNPSNFPGDDRPVETVSWDEAVEFCARLSKQTRTEYRLPTEAEWEYAARAGTTTPYYFGATITEQLANYGGNIGKTTSVGQFPPNAFGLYDMHGNVWEWCQDDWHKNYEGTDGKIWDLGFANTKVIRGSSWVNLPSICRSASRHVNTRTFRDSIIGFRVASAASRTG